MKNGKGQWVAIIGLALTLLLSSGKGFLWAGEQGQKVNDNGRRIERQADTFGQMDNRQRLLESQAAATQAILTAIQKKLTTMDKKLDARR